MRDRWGTCRTPEDAVVREFAEETGYRVSVDRLLEVASEHRTLANGTDFHGAQVQLL